MSEREQSTTRLSRVAERSSARSSRAASPAPAAASPSGTTRNGARTERPAATSGQAPAAKTVRRPRRARLRLTQVDAWSVMKTSFLLSIAMGIVTVVAVAIVWTVLGAAGVWDSLNNTIQTVMGNDFRIQDYVGTGRVLGFTMLVAVVDVVLITAIATLGAFLYNLSATLLGGIEVTLTEDN
ncbi:DUF3566 domain-containing protein [Nocardioides mangrovicus]|uniref:DUF3566 domain-containing protein n=1 Tax=Nocardioides mangrovicus TaxID=2478913 RepID=A0A3L8P0H0_9ACTN|nr:DUF3566 domain-containing protein [Nocardioides mangrovicus]RLV48079.1 DUF3566 domain-containing protein [Nocardioides mangrovicus]